MNKRKNRVLEDSDSSGEAPEVFSGIGFNKINFDEEKLGNMDPADFMKNMNEMMGINPAELFCKFPGIINLNFSKWHIIT